MSDERDEIEALESRVGAVVDGRYRLDALLGSGGLGAVYRAQHLGLDRPVALKLLHGAFADHEEVRARFAREARVLSTLEHEHIVRVSDFHTGEGVAYLCMELLEGLTLADLLDHGPPPVETVHDIARQILGGLAASHEKGILHRDLKPANIFLVPRGDGSFQVKILDFGLAKMSERESGDPASPMITRTGTILGTPDYMSPEQVASQPADARADVYSMGIVLYELLTGHCPFSGATPADLLRAHLVEGPPPLASMRPDFVADPALESLVMRALAKQRDARFADAREMLDALEAVPRPIARLSGSGAGAKLTPVETSAISAADTLLPAGAPAPREGGDPSGSPPRGLGRRLWLVALALALLGVLGAGGYALSHRTPPRIRGRERIAATAAEGADPPARVAARDPLVEVPPALRRAYRKVSAGSPLERDEIRFLRNRQLADPEDVRPSLLLAHDFASREWSGGAIERYRLVHQRDPSARGGAWFLDDLVQMTASASQGDSAAEAIAEIFGAEALPAIERALEKRELPAEALSRLEALSKRLGDA